MRCVVLVAVAAGVVIQFWLMAEAIGAMLEASWGWGPSRVAGLLAAFVPVLGGAAAAVGALGWLGWGWPAAAALFLGPFLVGALAVCVAGWGGEIAAPRPGRDARRGSGAALPP